MTELQKNLPPGWDCRFDERSGKYYYVNHYTRTTTWDDPRTNKSRAGNQKHTSNIQTEHIPLQHGSPDLRRNYVYPSQTTPIPAFQIPTHMSPKIVPMQDLKPRMSPLNVKSKIQDSSFTTSESDETVAKISAMFPTVSETHIKVLLKNCRYMKSVFPQADETIILEVLQNNENNIQKTTDVLKEMGFNRKDTVKIALQAVKIKKEEKQEDKVKTEPPTTAKAKTLEEKQQIKKNLQTKYKDVAEYLISIALESVHFDETRANDILKIMVQEDTQANSKSQENQVVGEDVIDTASTSSTLLPVSQSRQSIKSLLKTEKELEKTSFSRVIEEDSSTFKSSYLSNTKGPDPINAKGASEKLLLEDYLKWQGPNSNLKKGPQGLAKGPNSKLLSNGTYQPRGSNTELRKGPKFGLAKGSIFSQLRSLPDDSRGQ